MKYTDKLGLPIWNKPETDVFDIEQFNEGMQAIDDIVVNILKQINDLAIGDVQIDLNGYVKEEVLKEYAKRTELSKFLTQTDLLNYLDKTYLDMLATKDELSSYAKTDDLSSYALASSLSDYALKNSLLNYATKESLDDYALSCDLEGAINQLNSIIDTLQNRITALENQQGVTVRVTGVALSTNTLSMKVGGTTTLTANIRPSNATNKNVTWSTNNSSVASVNNGTVTAHAKGQATITVTTEEFRSSHCRYQGRRRLVCRLSNCYCLHRRLGSCNVAWRTD